MSMYSVNPTAGKGVAGEDEEDRDALYGPDAFMGDQAPVTRTGRVCQTVQPPVPEMDRPEIEPLMAHQADPADPLT